MPIGDFDYTTLTNKVSQLSATSGTPLGVSLAYAERSLDQLGDGAKSIVLLTDGQNTNGREPEEVFRQIQATNVQSGDRLTELYVIAFDTNPEYFQGLKDLGAHVFSAQDAGQLSTVLGQTKDLILEAPDP
ncbi:MAG: VWA domain-containing protein [Nanoarchaeota archaeon]